MRIVIMKKLIAFFLVVVFIFVVGCSTIEREERLNYTPLPIEQIPTQYTDNAFSINGFLAVKDQYDNQSINIRGIITYKYKCPPCPKGALCKTCANDYIVLADPIENITTEYEISI